MSYPAAATQSSIHTPARWDLRSDTVTTPCEGMREAMQQAQVDDNVLGHDPTVRRLEQQLAEMLGKEQALFVSTGTQSNLIATLCHCQRAQAVLTGKDYHLYKYEAGGPSVLGGLVLHGLPLQDDGRIDPSDIEAAVAPDDFHFAPSQLLSLENTYNGMAIALETIQAMVEMGRAHNLRVHLDGARFFNATTALGCSAHDLAHMFDSVSVCLSKGLGAPVGSVLVGSKTMIERARRWQKMLGGGMRQSGVLAAAGLYALEHGIDRLKHDHRRTQQLADFLRQRCSGTVDHHTNMIFWSPQDLDIRTLVQRLQQQGIAILGDSAPLRLVIHHQISDQGIEEIQDEIQQAIHSVLASM